ncbi:MAG: site-2 protease family protein [Acidobacteriales bacterium]|nr:site-2 protease family protein [Terriglobales bacterium]
MSDSLAPSFASTPSYHLPEIFAVAPPKQRYWLHLLLLLATIFSTLVVGARMQFNFLHNLPIFWMGTDSLPFFPLHWALQNPSRLLLGLPFSGALMLILMSHEMGHYLYCRHYGVFATLPFFIPAPTLVGTLGAFIRIRSAIRSRSALFDIGIAGPIAGFVVALITLVIALPHSKPMPLIGFSQNIQLGYPLIFRMVWRVIHPANLPATPAMLQRLNFHPVVIAAWVGMFATALNLLPGGQLDGGHIVFSIAPRAHKWISTLSILALIPLGIYCWTGWLIWSVLLRLSGMRHPVVAKRPVISGWRLWLTALSVVMLIVTLTPSPFAHSSLLEVIRDFRRG